MNAIITTDGKLLTFGFGSNGQLGHLNSENKPFDMLYIPKKVDYFDNYFVEDISIGEYYCLAIARLTTTVQNNEPEDNKEMSEDEKVDNDQKSQAFSWGKNSVGQCGTSDLNLGMLPKPIEALNDYNVLKVSAGSGHSLFLAEKNGETSLFACGDAKYGATGLTKTLAGSFKTPQKVTFIDKFRRKEEPGLAEILDIKAGLNSSFALI